MSTHYEVLGLAPGADPDVIKAAYRTSVRRLHPDRGGDPADMARANEAYGILSDPDKRAEYDRELSTRAAPAPNGGPTADDDIVDGEYADTSEWFTDTGWDETPEPEPEPTPTPSPTTPPAWDHSKPLPWQNDQPQQPTADTPDSGITGFLSALGLMALWTMTLIALGFVIIGGAIDDIGWGQILVNAVAVAAGSAVTYAIVMRRIDRDRFHQVGFLYPAFIAAITFFGLRTNGILGWIAISWAVATVIAAESGRFNRSRSGTLENHGR